MTLVIASGCVFNNYIDRDIDQLMERTKNRVLVKGLMSLKVALLYGTILGISGFLILYWQTNLLTLSIAFVGWFIYVVIYSIGWKRKSTLGTTLGGIAGAVPPVVGYCAVTQRFDLGAILLFLILFFWQMPHFYAISIYRVKDFTRAKIPILPLIKNIRYTKISMLIYIVAFTITAALPSFFGYAGWVYLFTAAALGLAWLGIGLYDFNTQNDKAWARKMFSFSIINIMILCMMMAVKL